MSEKANIVSMENNKGGDTAKLSARREELLKLLKDAQDKGNDTGAIEEELFKVEKNLDWKTGAWNEYMDVEEPHDLEPATIDTGAKKDDTDTSKEKFISEDAHWTLATNGYEIFFDTARNDYIVYQIGEGKSILDAERMHPGYRKRFKSQHRTALKRRTHMSNEFYDILLEVNERDNEVNSFLMYLDSLPSMNINSIKEGVEHEALTTLFTHAFGIREADIGAEHYRLLTEATRCILLGWVARNVYTDGLQTRVVPVFRSAQQGIGKSSIGRFLLPQLFEDTFKEGFKFNNYDDTANARNIYGKLMVEFAELSGRSINPEDIKSFISTKNDSYVRKYENEPTTIARRCLFYATSNREDPLPPDNSGSSRFVVFDIPPQREARTVRVRLTDQSIKALRVAYELANMFAQSNEPNDIYDYIGLSDGTGEIQARVNREVGYQYDPLKALKVEVEAFIAGDVGGKVEIPPLPVIDGVLEIDSEDRERLIKHLRDKIHDKELDMRTKLDRATMKRCLTEIGFEQAKASRGELRSTIVYRREQQ